MADSATRVPAASNSGSWELAIGESRNEVAMSFRWLKSIAKYLKKFDAPCFHRGYWPWSIRRVDLRGPAFGDVHGKAVAVRAALVMDVNKCGGPAANPGRH